MSRRRFMLQAGWIALGADFLLIGTLLIIAFGVSLTMKSPPIWELLVYGLGFIVASYVVSFLRPWERVTG